LVKFEDAPGRYRKRRLTGDETGRVCWERYDEEGEAGLLAPRLGKAWDEPFPRGPARQRASKLVNFVFTLRRTPSEHEAQEQRRCDRLWSFARLLSA
jgi:hypothetical protein